MNQPPSSPPVVREVHHYHQSPTPAPDPGIAVILEILPGMMLQTFGIGNIYAGNVTAGILMMVGYWVAAFLNLLLCFVLIGFITWPLTWIAFMILCPVCASEAAKKPRVG